MLSIKPFSSSGAASKYYAHGDYYGSEGKGIWLGLGAKELNLTGEFSAKTDLSFNNLLQGILPNGQILGRKTKNGVEHRPGIDLTFSAPKSFSIQMLVYADKQEKQNMEDALRKAVSSSLGYIEEKGYAIARKGKNGYIKEPIHKLNFATFLHSTNRNLEPQAHMHCFLANVAKCEDGKYRSLEFSKVLENNKFLGQVFRNELAIETKKLGFDITPVILSDGSSSFELSRIDDKLIKGFSTRRKEIEELYKLYGVTTKEGRDKIVINSRKSKQLANEKELKQAWQELTQKIEQEVAYDQKLAERDQNNINNDAKDSNNIIVKDVFKQTWDNLLDSFSNKSKSLTLPETLKDAEFNLKDLAHLCLEDVTYNQTTFKWESLLKKTMKFTIGDYGVREIEQECQKLQASKYIIGIDNLYTSKSLLTKEKQIIQYAKNAIDQSNPIVKDKYFTAHLEKFKRRGLTRSSGFVMNKQQEKALKHILCSKDKIIMVEGLPGVGKSTVLSAVRDISSRRMINLFGLGTEFKGLAPTASAAKTLQTSAEIKEANTIHSFLNNYNGYIEDRGKESLKFQRQEFKNVMIFVDECSLISTNIMWKLLKLQTKFGFRLVLTGDTKQLGAVEAGKPFEQMLQALPSVRMNQILRQQNKIHKEAVIASSVGKIEKSFENHKENIQEKSNITALAKEAASLYLQKEKSYRDQTLLVSPTRILRDKVNNYIKDDLLKEGSLHSNIVKFNTLSPKDMSVADCRFASSFSSQEDILRFNKSYSNGIEKNEYLRVKQVNHLTNSLNLVKENGQEIRFNLRKGVDYKNKFEVFNERTLNIQSGLKIVFTKNNREYGIINSETAVIKSSDNKYISLQFENGAIKNVPQNELKHIAYGYCVTVHTSQGKTFDNMIAAISSHKFLNNQKSWLVTLSRHRHEFTALVEDKNKLKTYLIKNKGNEISAMELQKQIDITQDIESSGAQRFVNKSKAISAKNKIEIQI